MTALLISRGANVNAAVTVSSDTPLHIAAARGDHHCVQLLLDSGTCDLTKRNGSGAAAIDVALDSRTHDLLVAAARRAT